MHVLEQVTEGMKVLDNHNNEIGTVEWVKLVDKDEMGQPIAAGDERPMREKSLVDNIAEAFGGDDLPEAVRAKLLHEGFIRMDADGLFARDRYILPSQIASVSGDSVVLKVARDDLVKH